MLTTEDVKRIVKSLESEYKEKCFVSEAHLQLQFAITGYKIFGDRFNFVPEYPGKTEINGENKKTEFDLLVFDKQTKEKTLIVSNIKLKIQTPNQKKVKALTR